MAYENLGSRQKDYEKAADFTMIRRLPLIVRLNGRSFGRLTKNLTKPFSIEIQNIMAETMMSSIMEIQGAVFGFQHHDEINFILRNDLNFDSEPWYQNRIQKINSVSSSLATLAFNKSLNRLPLPLDIVGDAVFDARVWTVPSIAEAVNYIIWRQQDCFKDSVTTAAQIGLNNTIGKRAAAKYLYKTSIIEKKELLYKYSKIDFEDYPDLFKKGSAAYKVPTIVSDKDEPIYKNKWVLNDEIPSFVEEKDFIYNILLNGHDIFRATNI